MSKRNRYFRDHPLTVWHQVYYMESDFHQLKATVHGGHVTWRGPVKHCVGGVQYEVLIDFQWPRQLKAWVARPALVTRPGDQIPHRYSDNSLCLHLVNEWNAGKIISRTIVPWIAHWLFHYEIWLITGDWYGGGVHPKS